MILGDIDLGDHGEKGHFWPLFDQKWTPIFDVFLEVADDLKYDKAVDKT